MRILKWIGHPVIFVIVYLLFITEGENFGGFYLIYLLLALPHGAMYAVLAAFGIAAVIVGFNLKNSMFPRLKSLLYLTGFCLMVLSLINFFQTGDQMATFEWSIPLLTFILLCFFALSFLANSILLLIMRDSRNSIPTVSQ